MGGAADKHFTVQVKGETARFAHSEILYFEKAGHRVVVHALNREISYYGKNQSVMEERNLDRFSLNLSVGVREGLSFSEPDLAIIIGTLLDNAMEACQSAEDKYNALSLSYKPDYLILRVENPVGPGAVLPKRMAGQGKSTKPDPENHGFGLNNVKVLVEKHGGLIEIDLKKSVFMVNIALLAEAKQAV